MNTQILEMALATITGILVVVGTYMIAKFTLYLTQKATREEIEMLYDLLDERDEELNRYNRMFGPLKDWEDSEQAQNSQLGESLFGEEDNAKGKHLPPLQIDKRYKGMEPDDDDDLPF